MKILTLIMFHRKPHKLKEQLNKNQTASKIKTLTFSEAETHIENNRNNTISLLFVRTLWRTDSDWL